MSERSYLGALFAVVEQVTRSELTTTSKKLLIAYVNEAPGDTLIQKGRAAVKRYAQADLPDLDSLRRKAATSKLDKLDHLVLKLEFEASRLRP